VTAVALEGAEPHLALLLAEESAAEPVSEPEGQELRLRLLGPTLVETPDGPVAGDWLDQRPGQVLKYLAAERSRVVSVDELAESVWPRAENRTLSTVRYFVHELRDLLEPGRSPRGGSSFILTRGGGYTLDADRVWTDADAFERGVRTGLAAANAGDPRALDILEDAVDLYRGDFLADVPYAVWAFNERERLMELAVTALRTLAGLRLARGDLQGAVPYVTRVASMQPLDLDAQREAIALSLRRGRRSEALRRYTALRARMMREFGEGPGFDLTELMEELHRMALDGADRERLESLPHDPRVAVFPVPPR
jgi:DNA-binding SARP family transcriptional activator